MNQQTGLTIPPDLRCFSGVVTLFRFVQAPPPGSVIGSLRVSNGRSLPLVQTSPTPLGGTSLASVDGRTATLCGRFVQTSDGRTALDVVVVNPGAPSPTGTPGSISVRTLLILLLLALLTDRRGARLGNRNQSNAEIGRLLSTPAAQSILGQLGIGPQDVLNALSTLT
jgi:hypothetical protein